MRLHLNKHLLTNSLAALSLCRNDSHTPFDPIAVVHLKQTFQPLGRGHYLNICACFDAKCASPELHR
jgi:hypothetical protein